MAWLQTHKDMARKKERIKKRINLRCSQEALGNFGGDAEVHSSGGRIS